MICVPRPPGRPLRLRGRPSLCHAPSAVRARCSRRRQSCSRSASPRPHPRRRATCRISSSPAPATSSAATSTTTPSPATTTSGGATGRRSPSRSPSTSPAHLQPGRRRPRALRLPERNGGLDARSRSRPACSATTARRVPPRPRGRLVPQDRREPLVDERVQPLALHGPAALRARPATPLARRPVGCRDRMGHVLGHVPEPGDPSLFCSNDPSAPSLPTGIASGQGKVTQDGAPDDQRIAIPADSRGSFPDGAYQSSRS